MDIISYECTNEVNDILVNPILRASNGKNVKCYRYPVNESGGHAIGPYLDDLGYYNNALFPTWVGNCLQSILPSIISFLRKNLTFFRDFYI